MKIINDKAIIPVFSGFKIIELESICFFKAANKITEIYFVDGKSVCLCMAIKDVAYLLLPIFFRCHRSFIVNILHVKEYNKTKPENLILSNNMEIIVSRRAVKVLLESLKEFKK